MVIFVGAVVYLYQSLTYTKSRHLHLHSISSAIFPALLFSVQCEFVPDYVPCLIAFVL